jgi:hypothetical protein
MNAQPVLVTSFSIDRLAVLVGARPEVDIASGKTRTRAEPSAPRDFIVQALGRAIAVSDVCDLIDAAGPLSLRDIAGGLDVSLHQASTVVGSMLEHDCLRQDEWERHRLSGACRA